MEHFKRRVEKYQSTTNGEHRYGIGKYFLKKKKVYLEDKFSKPLDTRPIMQEYLEKCKEEGLEINKLEFGLFTAKNGFQYEGFRATEEINPSDILIKVPRKLILNTRTCMFSDIQKVVKENLNFFTAKKGGLVEDHIMLVYLLRQYQLGKASPWYHLISNLSRYIDTVDFWEDEEYKYLDDPIFRERIRLQRNYFNYIAKNLREILPKYPDLFEEQTYSEENIRWIYIHIWSRSFGGSMDYISMVPIVEMMNHENTNMFFRIHKEGSEIEQVQITEEERLNQTSTENESYMSEDNIMVNEYDFEEFEEMKNQADQKMIKIDQNNPKLRDIRRQCLELEQIILNDFNLGDDVTIFFAGKIIEKIRKIELSALQPKKKTNKVQEEISRLNQLCSFFKELLKTYHKQTIKENEVINTSQKKIFEKDAKEAEQAIQQIKKQSQEFEQAKNDQESNQNQEEIVETTQQNNTECQSKQEEQINTTEGSNQKIKEDSINDKQIQNEIQENNQQESQNEGQEQQVDEISGEKEEQIDKQNEMNEQNKEESCEKDCNQTSSEDEEEEEKENKKEEKEEKKQIVVQEKEQVVEQSLNELKLEYTDNPDDWKQIQYDNFLLMADSRDRFEKGSQVYFCYNRLTNRSMLSKYGMALEYNKYEFVHLRYKYIQDIVEYAPYALSYIKYFELNTHKRFSIPHQRFNSKIISFAKAMMWDLETQSVEAIFNPTVNITLEIKGLEKVNQIYKSYLDSRMYSMDENESMLTKDNMNGHLYFATIYRLERQRIIKNQQNLVNILIYTLKQMLEQGEMGRQFFNTPTPYDEDPQDPEFFHRNRYILRKYIRLFPEQNKQF
ncbi:hypothetical protein TTHERM_00237390 (macronuclear) [Tetrahymena thermophila SB210]|uniref:SET domain protein n=1 Tax=Tetrahymena thermophila (strain SB210) TaxID=312017 RepID=I7LXF2_TETTS|nr:hypothetical protein TTHERM_00237390 [Tetrahymena thermophila SB210]EAS04524.1 hypothetical protein TTHERM_00237390 [Tetrahymena thermophila SB210]|eukprot:XP_001024769.1 hypothetical protein TTHERM_00237390 [Tetrahymena thermophila SB210]